MFQESAITVTDGIIEGTLRGESDAQLVMSGGEIGGLEVTQSSAAFVTGGKITGDAQAVQNGTAQIGGLTTITGTLAVFDNSVVTVTGRAVVQQDV